MLNNKQQMFVDQYLVDLNGRQAAIRAGYSERSAEVQASRLMSIVEVQQAIQERMDKRSKEVSITSNKVLERIDRIAKTAEDVGDLQAALRANELLGKHLRLFTEKIEHSGNMTFTILTRVPDEPGKPATD